jgi:GH18 family chitinase
VGYYEGWAPSRPCQGFWPEQIPKGIYTHLNYAFATIDPFTFDVMANNQREEELMKQLTDLKLNDPGLRVNIAVGGWTFNDDGPTATTFSDIARSETSQKKFLKSLIAFMAKYGFDGVDIDWEYPVADDRNGRLEDFANFAPFMANLKAALRSTGGRAELSLTIPTSYWYLQHFDLKNPAKHVDYFNYMSYDLHGLWDKGNKWTGALLDSHTNLTELRKLWTSSGATKSALVRLSWDWRFMDVLSPCRILIASQYYPSMLHQYSLLFDRNEAY